MPNVSKRVLHKLTFVLRVNFVEKPNISINFSQSVHSHSGLTVPEVLPSNWMVEFCIREIILKIWGLLTCLGRFKNILLWISNNSELTADQWTLFLTCRALIGRKNDWYFLNCLIFSAISQQLTSLSTTELLQTFDMSHCGCFEHDILVIFSQKTKMCLIIPYEEKKFITNFWTNFFPSLQKSQS